MSPTAKILLGAGAVGTAGYLLWRLWPKDEPITVTPNYQQPVIPVVPALATPAPVTVPVATLVAPAPSRMPPPVCPPGTCLNAAGACVPCQID